MSSLLKSLKVNKIYTVPENAVNIKKNINNKGGLLYKESFSMFNFTDMLWEKDAMSKYRLNKRKGARWSKSFLYICLLLETKVNI